MLEKFYYKSPIGSFEIEIQNDTILGLRITENTSEFSKNTGYFAKVSNQLDEYFAGSRKHFDLTIQPKGTEFQTKVWNELKKIPYGTTKSYQEIANTIGNPNAQRAVGSACNKNPILLIVPCHRVISKSGNLAGFAYGLNAKKTLLQLEKTILQ